MQPRGFQPHWMNWSFRTGTGGEKEGGYIPEDVQMQGHPEEEGTSRQKTRGPQEDIIGANLPGGDLRSPLPPEAVIEDLNALVEGESLENTGETSVPAGPEILPRPDTEDLGPKSFPPSGGYGGEDVPGGTGQI